VAAAIEAQRALLGEPWGDHPVKVRMGLHTGEAQVVDDDYVGMTVHVAARVSAAGHGGQTLVTEVTHGLAGGPAARDLGVHALKGVGEHRIMQLLADGLPEDHPPLRTTTALPNNLPAAVDEFVGRHAELDEVVQALQDGRLVTLTGPGGSGKTRLALEAAARVLPGMPHGVWFVPLAVVDEPGGIATAIGSAVGVDAAADETPTTAVARWLRERSCLLVLDDCEHLVEGVAELVQRSLASAPALRVLVTSREVLGVRGERAIRTPPLDIEGDAVALFVARAAANAPGFDAATVDRAAVAQVCRRLDGLPLAIELAAARLRALSLEQLAARLDDRFRILTGGGRGELARQRTLEAVVAWSYELLREDEREVFVRLAVFPDHFSLEMAEAVVAGGAVDELDVMDLVTRLVEKSLVSTVTIGGELRYRLLETLRAYALDRLVERGEVDRWRSRLLEWSLAASARVEDVLRTPAMDRVLRAAAADATTHRAAVTWALERDRAADALRIAASIPLAPASERLPLLEDLLERSGPIDDRSRAFALAAIGNIAYERGQWELSERSNAAAAALFESVGIPTQAAWSRYLQVHSAWGAGDLAGARALVGAAVEGFRAVDDRMGLGYALWVSSVLADDPDEGVALAVQADELLRAEDVPMGIAHNLEGRGLIELERGDGRAAARFIAEAIEVFARFANLGCTAHGLEAAAVCIARDGLDATAAELLGAAEELRQRSGQTHRPWEVRSRHGAIEAHLRLDATELAAAFARGRQIGAQDAAALALRALAGEVDQAGSIEAR